MAAPAFASVCKFVCLQCCKGALATEAMRKFGHFCAGPRTLHREPETPGGGGRLGAVIAAFSSSARAGKCAEAARWRAPVTPQPFQFCGSTQAVVVYMHISANLKRQGDDFRGGGDKEMRKAMRYGTQDCRDAGTTPRIIAAFLAGCLIAGAFSFNAAPAYAENSAGYQLVAQGEKQPAKKFTKTKNRDGGESCTVECFNGSKASQSCAAKNPTCSCGCWGSNVNPTASCSCH